MMIKSCMPSGKLLPDFIARNKKKRSAVDEGLDDGEIFERMQEEPPYFIFIDQLADFVEHIQHPAQGVGAMLGFMENITDKGEPSQCIILCLPESGRYGQTDRYTPL